MYGSNIHVIFHCNTTSGHWAASRAGQMSGHYVRINTMRVAHAQSCLPSGELRTATKLGQTTCMPISREKYISHHYSFFFMVFMSVILHVCDSESHHVDPQRFITYNGIFSRHLLFRIKICSVSASNRYKLVDRSVLFPVSFFIYVFC